jgi:hypothetical protein
VSNTTVTIRADFARRIPDPVFKDRGMERHIMFCAARDLPTGIPKDANPREQKTDRGIYRDVKKSLLNELGTPGTFHLKNKGITILAREVKEASKGVYAVVIEPGQGIVDGGHTYAIIDENRAECPPEQYVRLDVLTGVESGLVSEIAGGLNTAMQVQPMSLENLKKSFDWLKEILHKDYSGVIDFKENEEGEADVRDVIALLTLFNVELYPNDGQEYPIKAYTSKAATLDQYVKQMESYKRMAPIVKDILQLHDEVHLHARPLHNAEGGKAGKLSFMKSRTRGKKMFSLPFTEKQTKYMLYDGALYPMLGAFRWMVKVDPATKKMVWKTAGGLGDVLALLDRVGAALMRSTLDKSVALGRNPNAIGKDRGHWENLFKTVALAQLQQT